VFTGSPHKSIAECTGVQFKEESFGIEPRQIVQLKRHWTGEAFEAAFTSRSRGVGILIKPFKLISQHADDHVGF
jgi:hypothetical protein